MQTNVCFLAIIYTIVKQKLKHIPTYYYLIDFIVYDNQNEWLSVSNQ